jgi:hypothetical protein
MLLFHICIPFAVEHFRPHAVGLSVYLLPGAEEANGVFANKNEESGQDRGNNVFDENQERPGQ